jgi:hypothetical protein
MLPVLHGDLSWGARALLAAPPDQRAALARSLLACAERAGRHVRRRGALHPQWGDGSLMAVAGTLPRAREPFIDDPDYCACLITLLRAIARHKDVTGGCYSLADGAMADPAGLGGLGSGGP